MCRSAVWKSGAPWFLNDIFMFWWFRHRWFLFLKTLVKVFTDGATCADCILLLEVTWPNRSNDTKFCPNVFDECWNMCLSFLVNDPWVEKFALMKRVSRLGTQCVSRTECKGCWMADWPNALIPVNPGHRSVAWVKVERILSTHRQGN